MILTPGYALGEEDQLKVNWISGPKTVEVGSDLAQLNLPEKYLFANGEDAKKIMEYVGNPISKQEVGIVFPDNEQKEWFILFEYDPLGYVKDDEAKDLDAEAILQSIKDGTEQANKERKDQGVAPLEIIGWDEKPHYDSKTNNLVWSILAQSGGDKVINYNTRLLGRLGVTSVTLVGDPENIKSIKLELDKILANFSYVVGKKYSDYIPGKDKVAELGLAALIAGGAGAAASKLGLLAKILILFKKFWFIILAPVFWVYKKIKNRGDKVEEPTPNVSEEEENLKL